jgi:hypothetical protein
MVATWSARYLDRDRLRREVQCLAECFVEALLDSIPRPEVRGVYLKGSAKKRWESPIDYVPEISDVDMHVWFIEDDSWRRHLGTVSQALEVQRKVELRYRSEVSQPLHEPRPQLILMNKLMTELDGFVFSPRRTVQVLYGEDYPAGDYSNPDRIRRGDCGRLIEDEEYLGKLPLQVVDKPGRYLWESMRALVWRVSPIGPRVLHISGVGTEEAWSQNRTRAVSMLRDLGHGSLADGYTRFYLSAWDYFLSGFKDTDAGRSAIGAAAQALTEGAEVARGWLAAHPAGAADGE